jgi:hypothetical protein
MLTEICFFLLASDMSKGMRLAKMHLQPEHVGDAIASCNASRTE